jgi:ubiquinone/menaquinone biosynthesis C-methylase UbiE
MNTRRLEVLLTELQEVKDGSVLDLGCGYGFLFSALHKKFKRVVGLDISSVMLKKSKELGEGHVDLVVADAQYLPFKDDLFDCVTALNVFLHLDSPEIVLTEISRTTKRGGTVLVETMNKISPLRLFRTVANRVLGGTTWSAQTKKLLHKYFPRQAVQYYLARDIDIMAGRHRLTMSHMRRYLFVATQFPRALVIVASRLEKLIEPTPGLRRLTLITLHKLQKL